jgi:hypothetical protein
VYHPFSSVVDLHPKSIPCQIKGGSSVPSRVMVKSSYTGIGPESDGILLIIKVSR